MATFTEAPHVVNIRFEFPDVYVDRRGRWGNPFHITAQRTREQVIQDHKDWLNGDPQLVELVGPPTTSRRWTTSLLCIGPVLHFSVNDAMVTPVCHHPRIPYTRNTYTRVPRPHPVKLANV